VRRGPGQQTFGDHTYDIYLNDVVFWSNIPANLWEYTIGGYQVIKKWRVRPAEAIARRQLSASEARGSRWAIALLAPISLAS